MPVSPQEQFERALELLNSADELKFREAASTAFYAAYHLLKSLEDEIGDPCQHEGGAHAQLVSMLIAHPQQKLVSLGYMLRDCLLRRRRATYDMDDVFTKDEAKTQIEVVTRIFEAYRDIRKSGINLAKI